MDSGTAGKPLKIAPGTKRRREVDALVGVVERTVRPRWGHERPDQNLALREIDLATLEMIADHPPSEALFGVVDAFVDGGVEFIRDRREERGRKFVDPADSRVGGCRAEKLGVGRVVEATLQHTGDHPEERLVGRIGKPHAKRPEAGDVVLCGVRVVEYDDVRIMEVWVGIKESTVRGNRDTCSVLVGGSGGRREL